MSRQNVEALYPLSPLQEGMLFHSLYAPEAGAYFEQYVAVLEGELDPATLRAAWDRVVERHPVLRTAIVAEGQTRPVQVVRARVAARWEEEDWSADGPGAREERLREYLARDRERGFVLARAPLLRFFLARETERTWRFVWSYHHVLLDGWSVAIVVREALALYEGMSAGREPELPRPRPYRDYVAWLQAQGLEGAEAYWRGALSGAALPTPLGVDRPAAEGAAPDFGEARLRLPEEATRALGAFARARGLTLNTLVQGAWGLLLGRYSGEEEVVFGATVSGRAAEIPGIDGMVGLFINTVPVRVRAAPGDTLLCFLRRLQEEQLHARQFDHTPLVRIQQWCGARGGLFESLLAFENYPVGAPSGGGERRLRLHGIRSVERGSFPLALVVVPAGEQLRLLAAHDRARIDDRAAAALLEHLRVVLETLAAHPERPAGALSLLSPGERARVEAWGRGDETLPADALLHELVVEQARRTPGAAAVADADGSLTYAELERRSAALALRLRAGGVGPEARVGICAGRSVELVVAALAVLRAGGAYVPLDPAHPADRLTFLLADSGVRTLVTSDALRTHLPGFGGQVVSVGTEYEGSTEYEVRSTEEPSRTSYSVLRTSSSLAYVIYTSGSTGTPRGVLVEHRQVAAMARSIRDALGFRAGGVTAAMASPAFDIWGMEVWSTLLAGGTVRLVEADEVRDVPRLVDALADVQAMDAVPELMREIVHTVRAGPGTLPGIRTIVCGGDTVPPELLREVREVFPRAAVHVAYGPTEATIICASYPVPEEGPAPRPMVGRPLAGASLHVCDPWGNPLPVGVPGELWIGGAGVARGYGGRPDLTAERWVPDPFSGVPGARLYRSGDRVRWAPDGALEYVGRVDHQVKVRGHRVEPGEVEAALRRHPGVGAAAVVARDGGGGTRLAAYVVPAPGHRPDAAGLRAHLAGALPEYMVPSAFVLLDALPLTPNGKTDRRALPEPEAERGAPADEPPGTPAEEVLCGLWAELLGLERVGAGEDFFELGGHSLLATRLASRVREALGTELPLRAVFEAPTPAALARRVEALRRAPGEEPPPPLRPRERAGPVPLSFAQQRLWFIDQLEPGSALYNVPSALRLRGPLDVPALRRALAALVRRHEALRTTFRAWGDEPEQVVHPPFAPELPVAVLEGAAEEREAEARARAAREARRPFDLEAGPLVRAELLRLAEEEHVLLLTLHHVVTDGWSMGVLFRELGALYRAEAAGEDAGLPEPAVQYPDYALWQREWLRGPVLERQLAYWRERLAGVPALLELPADRPRPPVQSHRGALLPLELPAELGAALARLSRREGATLFMTLLAGVQALLGRYAGQERVAVGTPIANRTRAETEGTVGFFANTVALVGELGGAAGPSFRELLRRAREATLGAHAHQELPFERLVEALGVERSLAHAPLVQVVFALQPRAGGRLLDLGEVEASRVGVEGGTARFDLELSLAEAPDGALRGIVSYAADLFDRSTVERMAGHLRVLLGQVAARPEARVGALALFTGEERRNVLEEWSGTARTYPATPAHRLFAARAAETPDAVAVRCGDERSTYAALEARSARIAALLRARGVGPETPVALCLERGPLLPAAVLGVLRAGGAWVPLDPDAPAGRTRRILEDVAPRLVLSQRALTARLPEGCETLLLDGPLPEVPASIGDLPAVEPESLAYVIYTSGSTGAPKGVRVTHASLAAFLQGARETFGFGPGDVVPCLASPAFDIWAFEALLPLSAGATVRLVPRERVLDVERLVEELRGCTVLHAVPALMRQLAGALRVGGSTLPELRAVFVGGDAVPPDLLAEVRAAFPAAALHVMYGPTEATVIATAVRVGAGETVTRQLMGRPLPNARVYVCDAAGEPVPVGVPGEVWLGGAGVARGYGGRPELTAEKFVPDPYARRAGARAYRTGDRARWLPEGTLEFLGRVDRQVKVRGFRIEPGEIEAALLSHPGVRDAVVEVRGEAEGRRLVGYVEAAEVRPTAGELRAWVGERVPEYMVPGAFVVLERFPLTATGKVDRRALPAPEREGGDGAGAGPRTPTEEVLAGVWAELLGLERVGAGEDFFALGGHSLLATRVVSRIRTAFGIELPVRALFEEPTVAGLAARVDALLRAGAGAEAPPVVPVPRDGAGGLPLSFAQQRLWFIDQVEPGAPTYNMPLALRLRGPLDAGALERALAETVRRHESLRTRFPSTDAGPVQVVDPAGPAALPRVELGRLAAEARERELLRLAAADALRPFDLARGPLLRAALVALDAEDHGLLLSVHHAVSDGWSTGILLRELSALYGGERLPEPPVQYADYAVWQRARLAGETLERELAWWTERLAGAPRLLELPTDRPRSAGGSGRAGAEPLALSAEASRALRALARGEGATLFMTLLAGFQVLLGRWAGQDDVVVGTPVAGRTREETEGLIGFFVNTLALRTGLSSPERTGFRALLGRVRETALGAYAHQELPFERLVEALGVERSLAHAPVFQASFALQDLQPGELRLGGVRAERLSVRDRRAKFDLALGMGERGDALAGWLEYDAALLDAATARRMADHLAVLLERAAADPDAPLAALGAVPAAELRTVLEEWNGTARTYPATPVHELFAARAAETPDAAAVRCGDEEITYAALEAYSARIAALLRARGVGPETPVALCLERGPLLPAAVLGVLRAGGAWVPLDPDAPAGRTRRILEDVAPRLVLAQRSLAARLPEGCETLLLDGPLPDLPGSIGDLPAVDPESLAYVIYTSGSTGTPKGVRVTHGSLAAFLQGAREAFGFGAGDVVPCLASPAFDIWAFEALLPLVVGATVRLVPRERVLETERLVEELRGCTMLHAVPALMRQLAGALRASGGTLPELRAVFVGGDAVPPDLLEEVRAAFPAAALHVMYGPTEATVIATAVRVGAGEAMTRQLMGRPLPNARVYVCDAAGEPVPVGVPGEVWLGGVGVARGYGGRPELTAEKFVPDPYARRAGARAYRTGDRARWLPGGVLEFLGRTDRQVKVRGFRIEPGEIEAALLSHPGVRDAAVEVRGDGEGRRLVGYVEPAPGARPTAGELRAWAGERVPEYMVPGAFVVLERFPLTATGKVDRRALPAPEREAGDGAGGGPRTPTEEVLAGIWAELLGLERVGTGEDFFALGGHSLLATRVVSRIRTAFGIELPVRALFEAPTVAGLAERVDAAVRAGQGIALPPLERADRSAPLPLSFAQERLWILDRLVPGGSVYNMPVTLRLRGALDLPALRAALDALVERHESLRTTFAEHGGRPVQEIRPAAGAPLRFEPLDGVPEEEREARALAAAAEEAWAPFDLAAGPLFRAALFRVGEEDHVLVLAQHHAVTDGWSVGVLFRELGALYGAYVRGEASPLEEPGVQYADYAVWQRGWLAGEALERQTAWWRERLAGAPPVLALPLDRPRPPVQAVAGAERHFTLLPEVRAGVEALSRREGATPFMALLAAWQLLLARYAGEDDVTVGTPVAGRTHEAVEGVIGMFVNTLALRSDLSGDPSFRELLGRAREATLGAYAHQDLPFERLVEALAPERSLSHHPLFQVTFTLQGAASGAPRLPGLEARSVAAAGGITKFDLSLSVAGAGDGWRGAIGYATELFDPSTAERMAGHLRTLLARIARDPDARLSALSPMDEAEAALVAAASRGAERPLPGEPVHEAFAARAAAAPGAVAVAFGAERVTYAALHARAAGIAASLRARGVGPEDRVGVCLERGPALVAAVLGVMMSGAAYVPLDPAYPAERIRFVAADAGLAALLTQASLAASVPAGGAEVVLVDGSTEYEVRSTEPQSRTSYSVLRTSRSAAYVLYTSGSTGAPKGVVVEHGALANTLAVARDEFGFGAGDVAPVLASCAFDIWAFEALVPLLAGGTARIVPREEVVDTERLARELEGVTVLHAVPALMRQLCAELRGRGRTLPGIRAAFVGGDAVPPELLGEMREAFPAAGVHVLYGPTEGTILASGVRVGAGAAVAGPLMGRPLPNARLHLLDPAGAPVPVGVPGEVYLGGAGVARGYHGRADLTAERFVPDPFGGEPGARMYRTGDRARRLPGGTLEFLGRVDRQVKIRGFRIEPGEVEAALAEHPAVREAAAVAREGSAGPGELRLVGYAALAAEAPPVSGAELRTFLRERLPEHMVPSEVLVLDALPLTPTGKLDRGALPAPERPLVELAEELGMHRTPTEEVVAAVWADVLRLPRVGGTESFFALGGHSLLATRVVSRLRTAFGIELPVRALFEAPTVAELAERVDAAVRAGQGIALPPLERADRSAPLPLSFAQERLWILDRLVPGGSVYNMPVTLRLRGALDPAALRAALDALVERHESLRTTFAEHGGRPVQEIRPAAGAPLRFEPLDGVPEEEREARALAAAAEEAWAPFDLAAGPLFRAALFRVGEEDHVLVLAQHHAVTDGWSTGVLFRELGALYGAYVRGEASPLEEPAVQYADYAVWQRGWLAGEALERQTAWWRERLAGAPPLLELPTDRPRGGVQGTRGASHHFRVPAATVARLRELSREEGATLFMTALAAFQLLLARYARQDDVVVGTPVAGRTHEALEGMVGMFVNTLALRTDLGGDPSFRELLGRVREATLGAYAHQDLPFEKLVDEIHPERDAAHSPVFQAVFALQNLPSAALQLPGLVLEPAHPESRTAKVDLALALAEADDGMVGALQYGADLFDAATVERMAAHLGVLLAGVAGAPAEPLSGVSLLDDAERRLLEAWSRPAEPAPPAPVHARVAEHARLRPDAPAVHVGEATTSFAELDARAEAVAERLRARGVGPETRVGIAAERGPGMVAAALGVLRAGGAYVPLDPSHPEERLAYVLEDAGVALVLADPALAARLPLGGRTLLPLDGGTEYEIRSTETQSRTSYSVLRTSLPENAAYVIYTSGSTGRPKGVVATHGGLASFAAAAAEEWGIGPDDVSLALNSFAFDVWVQEVLVPLAAGAAVRVVPAERVLETDRLLEEMGRATLFAAVPAVVRAAADRLRETGRTLPGVRHAFCGGEAVPAELLRAMREAFPGAAVRVVYGPTETTVAATGFAAGAEVPERASIGRGHGGVALQVRGPRGEACPVGVPGELWVGGPQVARGYLGRPELTAETFVPDPEGGHGTPGARVYRTGDLVRRLPDGSLEFLGRLDGQVKVRGFRIEPGEIEAVLARHPAVRGAAAVVREDRPGDRRIVAYLEAPADFPVDEARALARAALPEYMVPAAWVVLERLPRTATGKTDRRALPAPEAAPAGGGDAPPRTELERAVAGVWEEVLGTAGVGIHRSFFDLGGNSLLAVRAAAALGAVLEREVPVLDLFRHSTVAALARHLSGGAEDAEGDRAGRLSSGKGRLERLRKRRKPVR